MAIYIYFALRYTWKNLSLIGERKMKPDYNNSILNISNSILKHYGAANHHNTLPLVDKLLEQKYKNVVLLVMDGMGVNVLEKHLPGDSFLRLNKEVDISSVYPCTTTAALTSIQSGKTPIEHGWIGWSNYFKEVDKCVDLFTNNESGMETAVCSENIANKYLAFDSIFSQLENKVKTMAVSPFTEYFANTMEGICEHVKNLCVKDGKKFIYAYHYRPDYDMHELGVSNDEISKLMIKYNAMLEKLANSLKDTLLLITADHGMIDVTMECIEDYPQLSSQLKRHICVEPRCCSFYVRDEFVTTFPKEFKETFADKFILYTHDEFINSNLLGYGEIHYKVKDFVGDYVAIAVSDVALWYRDVNGVGKNFKGAHAGLTKEEMIVPLIVIERK